MSSCFFTLIKFKTGRIVKIHKNEANRAVVEKKNENVCIKASLAVAIFHKRMLKSMLSLYVVGKWSAEEIDINKRTIG